MTELPSATDLGTEVRLRDLADRLADRLLEIWHETGDDEKRSAHEFMDMTWDEYKAWVERAGIWRA